MDLSDSENSKKYYKRFLKSNPSVGHEGIYSVMGFSLNDVTVANNINIKPKPSDDDISKFMKLSEECIVAHDYKNAIKYLDKVGSYEPALAKKSDLIILEAIQNTANMGDDYFGFWRNIGYLTEDSRINDEALLIKAYYFLDAGLFERSLECYDYYLKRHMMIKEQYLEKWLCFE